MSAPRHGRKGRPSMLENPEFCKAVAALIADGMSRQAIMDELADNGFEVKDKDTITRWKRDPRVKAMVHKLIEDRALEISRKVDSTIAGILSQADTLSVKDLILIRKEYGGAVVGRKEVADGEVTAGAVKALEDDPELAAELQKLLAGEREQESEPVEA